MKQVIIVRNDLKMGKGKIAAQVAHASLSAFLETFKKERQKAEQWIHEGQKKVVLKVESLEKLMEVYEKALKKGLIASLIEDRGLTQLEPGTITCVAIGPDDEERIDEITKDLKLL